MSQKYQNEKSPILNGLKKPKTSEKVQKIRDLEGPTSFCHLCSTLYIKMIQNQLESHCLALLVFDCLYFIGLYKALLGLTGGLY